MSAPLDYVPDSVVAELVRAAHERGVRAGLDQADDAVAQVERGLRASALFALTDADGIALGHQAAGALTALRAIRSLDPATIKEDADGRE